MTRRIASYEQQQADLTEALVPLTEMQCRMALYAGAVGANAIGQIVTLQENGSRSGR